MKVVAGSGSPTLGVQLARELGADLVPVTFEKHLGGFPDREQYVRLQGELRDEDVVVVQSTHPDERIVELILLVDAVRESNPRRVMLVIPYFGYQRQDRKFEPGEAVSARALAKRLQVGVDSVVTVSVHAARILHYFDTPAKDVSGMPAIGRYLRGERLDLVLAPDQNARRFAKEVGEVLDVEWDSLEKKRIDSRTVEIAAKSLDIKGRQVAIVDDVISYGSTIAKTAEMLRDQGAKRILAACVHGVFAANALERLRSCDDVIATDTLPSPASRVSVAPEIAATLLQ